MSHYSERDQRRESDAMVAASHPGRKLTIGTAVHSGRSRATNKNASMQARTTNPSKIISSPILT
jgi:hypothetical protein